MISKHSHEQSEQGEGVHVVKNEPCEDEKYGKGQFTEKRVYLSRYRFDLFLAFFIVLGSRDGTNNWAGLIPGVDAICGLSLLLVLILAPRVFL